VSTSSPATILACRFSSWTDSAAACRINILAASDKLSLPPKSAVIAMQISRYLRPATVLPSVPRTLSGLFAIRLRLAGELAANWGYSRFGLQIPKSANSRGRGPFQSHDVGGPPAAHVVAPGLFGERR
jgi:hypothetical protein